MKKPGDLVVSRSDVACILRDALELSAVKSAEEIPEGIIMIILDVFHQPGWDSVQELRVLLADGRSGWIKGYSCKAVQSVTRSV